MPLNANFTRVTLGEDPATGGRMLFVEGTSAPANGADPIFVTVPYAGEILSASVDDATLTPWEARFPEGATPFEAGGDIFVVGVAIRPAPHDPFVWQGSFQITSRTTA